MAVNTVAPTNPAVGLREGLLPSCLPEMFGSAAGGLEDVQRALLNILEDLHTEKEGWENGQRAFLNILEDSSAETTRLEDAQRAALNILEDVAADKGRIEDANRAFLNILDDSAIEKEHLEDVQRAALNILDDFDFERHRVEQINQQLAKEIQERKMTQEQLVAANQELEAFTYSVAHDLRAPLRSIDGFSQALLEDYGDKFDAQGQDNLRRVRAAAQRMAELIEGLLTLSRVTRTEMRREKVDLTALAQGVVEELQRSDPHRPLEVAIADGLAAQGDARLLRGVLQNLLGNAWKFTSRKPEARIEFGWSGHTPGSGAFFVRDNGDGFDMAYADKLFAPFQRLHRQSEFPGTGIGLATVQRIVLRHGGRVWAEGTVGRGAAFYFTLRERG